MSGRGALYGLSAAAIWGGMYVVSDVVLETIPPFTLLALRLILGLIVLALILGRMRDVRLPQGGERLKILGIGLLGFGISVGAQFVGTEKSTAVNGSLITSASPAFILIFAALILRERLTPRRIMAVGLATIGVALIVDPAQADFGSETFAGDVALAIAALTWGLYSVLVRQVSARLDTLVVTIFAFIGGLCLVVPAAFVELSQRPIGAVDAGTILGILYLGIASTAGAMWLWNRAFALVDASTASLFFFAQPVVGAFLGVVLLGQALTPNIIAGGLLIVLGVLLSVYTPARLKRPQSLQTVE
ncbi:MAG: DMT family transporter [Chloroflexota bacterium]|nr:MAG: EamA family transporter [Chloroflexota bacterium]